MEIKQYIYLLRRWLWLIILALVLGALGGFLFSRYQSPVYQATTKVLIMQSLENRSLDILYQNESQLAQTFIELIVTRPIIEAASVKLDTPINPRQVRVQQVRGAQLIEVIVQDSDPEKAALIANTLVEEFVSQNEELQIARFSESEENLQAQIQQVEKQINDLQNQSTENYQEAIDNQLQQVTKIIADLQQEIRELEEDIIRITYSGEPYITTNLNGVRILVTPTPSVDTRIDTANKQNRLAELKNLLNSYQDIYVTLSFSPGSKTANTSTNDQAQAALTLYQQIYSNLLSNYEAVRLSRLRDVSNIVQVEAALPPQDPIAPKPIINTVLGGVIGLVLAVGTAFIIEYLDDTLRTPDEITHLLGLPILGYIGEMPNTSKNEGSKVPYVADQPRSSIAEAFRSLRTNLEFVSIDQPIRTLLITSSVREEGKTTIATNLASSIAQANKKVSLLDADLRRPQIHIALKLKNRTGLSDILRERTTLNEATQRLDDENLFIVTSGGLPPNPVEVLNSEKMASVLREIEKVSDIVIIDGPPFILAETSVLSARVDGVLIVIRPNHTRANSAMMMIEQFERTGARVVGVVLNQIRDIDSSYYYGTLKDYSYTQSETVEVDEILEENNE